HGRYVWDPAYRHAGRTIRAIGRLAEAADHDTVTEATRQINGRVTAIMQLPAIDLEEKPRQREGICPQCDRGMLWIYPRSGRVACVGCKLRGQVMTGTVSAGCVQWANGELT